MIPLRKAFYHKVGTHVDTSKIVYKYYFASIDPHFYFAVYMIPGDNGFVLGYEPTESNIMNDAVIEFDETREYAYGENIELVVKNSHLLGYGDLIKIRFSIDEKPVIVNSDSVKFPDMEGLRDAVKAKLEPLERVKLFALYNTIRIELESKIRSIMSVTVGVQQDNAINAIIKGVVSMKSVFVKSLPEEMDDIDKESVFDIFQRMSSTAPITGNVVEFFAENILFARMLQKEEISLLAIPYEIRFRLAQNWIKYKSDDAVNKLKTAADLEVKTETISINMSTMEDVSKVYEVLNKTQAFVYLTEIKITRDSTGEEIVFQVNNEYYENFVKTTESCDEVKWIPSDNGDIYLQYSYAQGCDPFVGMKFVDNSGAVYCVYREDKIVDNDFTAVRIWKWGDEEIIKYGTEVDDSEQITVEFKGV